MSEIQLSDHVDVEALRERLRKMTDTESYHTYRAENHGGPKSLLQFTGSNLLLVRGFVDCVGSFEPRWYVLASSPLVCCLNRALRYGDRLRG